MTDVRCFHRLLVALLVATLVAGCASLRPGGQGGEGERVTRRDRTAKGAGYGAAAGAAAAILLGEREADEILVGAAIGAGIGAGVGAYMDRQQEKLAKIPGTKVERVEEDMLLLRLDSDLLFAVDSAQLSADSLVSLDQAARIFNEYPKTAIVLQGHTDSTGTEEHNEKLSERRAKAVLHHLVGMGVAADRMLALGYGEAHPIAPNDTEDGRRLNRRVSMLLKAKAR
ncbi:MAG: OmpA family protein [Acidobacteriota bacterium]|nr:MAG: OmpA family protein [Acidobacteriota bacterium]